MSAPGYTPERLVWAIDRLAHRAGPVHRDLIEAFPDRYEVDEKHEVVDARGFLLPSKPVESKAPEPVESKAPEPVESKAPESVADTPEDAPKPTTTTQKKGA